MTAGADHRTGQSRSWRLFYAARLDDDTSGALWRSLAGLREGHPDTRWTPAEQYHATLLFLGATDPGRVEDLLAAARQAARGRLPFRAGLAGAGGRVDGRRGGVAWLSVAAGRQELSRLSLDLDGLCGIGQFARRRPSPHVTVARRVDEELLENLRSSGAGHGLAWIVDRLVLYRSHSGPAGSRYEVLAEVPLAG